MDLRKQAIINTVGNCIYLAAQWLIMVMTTRFLGYEAVGILTLAMSVGNVFIFIQFYGVRSYQSSDINRKFTPGDYLGSRVVTVSIGLLLCVLFLIVSGYNKTVSIAILLFTLFRTFEAISDVFFGDIQRSGKLELAGICMLIRGALSIIIFYVGVKLYNSLNMALFMIVIGSLGLSAFIDNYIYRKTVNWIKGSVNGYKSILVICFPLLLSALLPTIITAFPRIVLEKCSEVEIVGYYGNISTPAVVITALVPNIIASLMPVYGEMVSKKDYHGIRTLWKKTLLGTTVIFLFCIIGVFVLGKFVLAWIYTDAIIPYVHYLYPLLVATTLYAFTMCGGSVLVAMRRNSSASICAIIATIVSIGLTYLLVPTKGIPGAIVVLIISYLLQTILQATIIIRNTKLSSAGMDIL